MPIVKTKGAASSQGFGEFAQASTVATYIEDVFSTYLYTGTGASRSIVNGIDLSTKGGLVWTKDRSSVVDHSLIDTVRGGAKQLASNLTDAQYTASPAPISAFNTTGYSLPASTNGTDNNYPAENYASWTFRKQPKFFDVQTFTSNSSYGATVSHNLGSAPGCILIKCTGSSEYWIVWHRSLGNNYQMQLNTTNAQASVPGWITTSSTSITITNGYLSYANTSYVAYFFAHDAGGFGLTGADNVISCGSYVKDGSGNASVTLGYEPQWIIAKPTSTTGRWYMYDNMRGMSMTAGALLSANYSNAESSYLVFNPTATGFNDVMGSDAGETYIYIAIRRGPMKVPTSGTSVFTPLARSGTGSATTVDASITTDLAIIKQRNAVNTPSFEDRLRGATKILESSGTGAEATNANYISSFAVQTGYSLGTSSGVNSGTGTYADWVFKRAPSFFDEVCYTGTGVARTVNHNLGVAPELILLKCRNAVAFWPVYAAPLGTTKYLSLNQVNGASSDTGGAYWNNTSPTSSVFSLGIGGPASNSNGNTYVAYLFATCAGVSKVGSYTGNGSTQTINCGFTGGARFVLIKRTDASGDWYVYDTARGMTTLTDPYLLLNSTAAESATLGSVTTVTTGFAVDASILAAVNTNAASYIFLAIA